MATKQIHISNEEYNEFIEKLIDEFCIVEPEFLNKEALRKSLLPKLKFITHLYNDLGQIRDTESIEEAIGEDNFEYDFIPLKDEYFGGFKTGYNENFHNYFDSIIDFFRSKGATWKED